ncbi:hypothetical protein CDAR_64011 [Caerostris darwini]|uniref:Uncharacterized protein n=1 Tax=Caerostris darwini TaxID=1538125 RepID=A0AAV4PJN4_9ARAC|nr:hypothetical protein CDAR_64011 [Caerostris darwini]
MPDKIYGYSETETEKRELKSLEIYSIQQHANATKKQKQHERNFFFKEMATVFSEQYKRFTFRCRSEKTGIYIHRYLFSRAVSIQVKKLKRKEAKVFREGR